MTVEIAIALWAVVILTGPTVLFEAVRRWPVRRDR